MVHLDVWVSMLLRPGLTVVISAFLDAVVPTLLRVSPSL
jgi:hypothetical protein